MISTGCICAYTWGTVVENGKVRVIEVRNSPVASCPAQHSKGA